VKLLLVFLPLLISVYGCAAVNTIPEGAVPLSTEEINTTFSGVRESYKGKKQLVIGTLKMAKDALKRKNPMAIPIWSVSSYIKQETFTPH